MEREYGFPKGDVIRLCKTLIRTGKEYRSWSLEDAKNGRLTRAFQNHRDAQRNFKTVIWWVERHDGLQERILSQ